MSVADNEDVRPEWLKLPDEDFWASARPVTALTKADVRPGDRIKTYVPDKPELTHRYEILSPIQQVQLGKESADHAHAGEQEYGMRYRDLKTGTVRIGHPCNIGLSTSEEGVRYCWAIPDDEDD